jgi:putative transposase
MSNAFAQSFHDNTCSRYRFRAKDRIQIGTANYIATSFDADGYSFSQYDDPNGLTISLLHGEIMQQMKAGNIVVFPDWYDHRKAEQRIKNTKDLLSDLPVETQRIILWRIEFCQRFLKLEKAEPTVSRSDDGMQPAIQQIHNELQRLEFIRRGKAPRCGRKAEYFSPPSPRSLRRWLTVYADGVFSPTSLRPGTHRSGNRIPQMHGDSRAFASGHARNFASLNRPTKILVYCNYEDALRTENQSREQSGEPPLEKMGRRAFERLIGKLPPFFVYAGRYGREAAIRHFHATQSGLDVIRPLERVEMDEYSVSLQALLVDAGLWARLPKRLKDAVHRTRAWLTVAIDCATRCILSMRLLATAPSSQSALSALEMAIYDKADLADAVGTGANWEMHGLMETLVTDGGAAFIATQTQAAIRDLGIAYQAPPGGLPYLRGTIERFFLTVQARLLPLFPGQTFENALSKGAYDSEGNACISIEELNRIIIRYAVDIYHETQHEGLAGETPRNAWKRLTRLYGVLPPPSEHIRRHVFGLSMARRINNKGIRILGLQYQSAALQKLRSSVRQKLVTIRVNRYDLGYISVQSGEGWLSVPCVFSEISGMSIREWMAAAKDLRRKNAEMASLDKDIVRQAMDDLRQCADMAVKRAEIGEPIMSSEDLEKAERELFRAFEISYTPIPAEGDWLPAANANEPASPQAEQPLDDLISEFGDADDWMPE